MDVIIVLVIVVVFVIVFTLVIVVEVGISFVCFYYLPNSTLHSTLPTLYSGQKRSRLE